MDRKTFIQKTAGAMLVALPASSLLGCSSSDDGGGETPTPDPMVMLIVRLMEPLFQ